jgi:hypothetical protein
MVLVMAPKLAAAKSALGAILRAIENIEHVGSKAQSHAFNERNIPR